MRPADLEPFLVQELVYHRDVDVIQVDFARPQSACVFAPVVPQVPDDLSTEDVRGLVECGGSVAKNGAV